MRHRRLAREARIERDEPADDFRCGDWRLLVDEQDSRMMPVGGQDLPVQPMEVRDVVRDKHTAEFCGASQVLGVGAAGGSHLRREHDIEASLSQQKNTKMAEEVIVEIER